MHGDPKSTPIEERGEHLGILHPNDAMCPHPTNHGVALDGPAIQLCCLGTNVDAARVRDPGITAKTLSLSKWCDGIITLCTGYLRALG